MKFEEFAKDFETRCRARGVPVDALTVPVALDLMTAFYRDELVTGIDPPPDDALRFSWGVRDRGEGDHFEINLARVVSTRRMDAPPLMRELEVTFRLSPTPELRSVPHHELWCYSRPELPDFVGFVRDSEAYAIAQRETVLSVSLASVVPAA